MENYGKYWTIDHVDPCCNYDVTTDNGMKLCFHWSNLRPIIKLENQKKTGKTIQSVIDAHKLVVIEFLDSLHIDADDLYTTKPDIQIL